MQANPLHDAVPRVIPAGSLQLIHPRVGGHMRGESGEAQADERRYSSSADDGGARATVKPYAVSVGRRRCEMQRRAGVLGCNRDRWPRVYVHIEMSSRFECAAPPPRNSAHILSTVFVTLFSLCFVTLTARGPLTRRATRDADTRRPRREAGLDGDGAASVPIGSCNADDGGVTLEAGRFMLLRLRAYDGAPCVQARFLPHTQLSARTPLSCALTDARVARERFA